MWFSSMYFTSQCHYSSDTMTLCCVVIPYKLKHSHLEGEGRLIRLGELMKLARLKKQVNGAEQMDHPSRALATLAKDLVSGLSTHTTAHTACNSRSRHSGALFWPLAGTASMWCT